MGLSSSSFTLDLVGLMDLGLLGRDWTISNCICKSINSNKMQAKDVVKAVKKRLQDKDPKVKLLSLELLDTMFKNCGDSVRFQIVEEKILEEMTKIVKKKAEKQVKEKILELLHAWQEALGGNMGKPPNYYCAYEELRRSGVEFPKRSLDAARPEYAMPSNSAPEIESLRDNELPNTSLLSLLAQDDATASGVSTVELEISREGKSTSKFVVRDGAGSDIFKFHGKRQTVPGGILVDSAETTVFRIEKQIFTAHGRWVVYEGNSDKKSDPIFRVRRSEITGEKTKLVVFWAENKEEIDSDYHMEGSQSENLPIIYRGNSSTKVAEVHRKAVTRGVLTSEDIVVKIYQNIDPALIVTLVVIHEYIKEIGENRKEFLRRAGKSGVDIAVKLATTAAAYAMCGGDGQD